MKTEYINVRIDPELKRQLEDCAEVEGRSLSNQVIYIIKKYLDNNK